MQYTPEELQAIAAKAVADAMATGKQPEQVAANESGKGWFAKTCIGVATVATVGAAGYVAWNKFGKAA